MYKKKFKNDQDICWLEEDCMEMKKIIRDQSKNNFHLTPKIASLCPPLRQCPDLSIFFYVCAH